MDQKPIVAQEDRVEIPAHTDSWMRGDRFGTVVALGPVYARVYMDRSGAVLRFRAEDLKPVKA